ncbi:putative hydroxymethylpyrimidine transporter CytX [Asticcacaulis solisilvae]|uniref:putative hydroxymethylpyrimidine transporter CytX n=1 Tax=Asticcacaulis solisilvae TaxID=1217274 RepID=UPI003FD7074C
MADLETDAYDPLLPVPEGARSLKTRDAFSLWFSLGIGLLVLQAGAGLVPGLSFTGALLAIVIGSLLGAVLLALAGVVGADTGLATIAALRPTLGKHGAAVPAVLNVVQLVGWGIFEIAAMRDAADALTKSTFQVSAPVVWTIVFGIAATALAVMGPLSFVRRILRRFGLWLVLLGAAWMTFALLSRHDLGALFTARSTGSGSLGAGIDIVAAMPLSWLPLIADYSRFGRPRDMFRGSAAGYFLANVWFYALGAAFALVAANGQDLLLSALAATGGGLALLMILIDETDNVFADIFSAATSAATVIRLKVRSLTIGFGILCTGLALFVPMGQFVTFLYMIGSVFAPLYGVLLADHFLVRRRQVAGRIMPVNGYALACWALGVAAYYAIVRYLPALGATLPALAISGGLYWGLRKILK